MLVLYENIKNLRKKNGMTQEELGEKLGYERSMISKIESGAIDLSQSKIVEFAKVLNTTPKDLMGWNEKKPVPSFEPEHIELIDLYSRLEPEQKQSVLSLLRSLVKK